MIIASTVSLAATETMLILAQHPVLAQGLLAQDFLAQNPNETGPEFGKASPFGLVIILALLAATALLIRSMNSRLRKLPNTFDRESPVRDQAADEGTDRAGIRDEHGLGDGHGSRDEHGSRGERGAGRD